MYSTWPGNRVGWISLIIQPKSCLLAPFTSSYKNFKESLYKVVVGEEGHHFCTTTTLLDFPSTGLANWHASPKYPYSMATMGFHVAYSASWHWGHAFIFICTFVFVFDVLFGSCHFQLSWLPWCLKSERTFTRNCWNKDK